MLFLAPPLASSCMLTTFTILCIIRTADVVKFFILILFQLFTSDVGCAGMLCCIVLSILMMITHSNFGRGLKEKCKP